MAQRLIPFQYRHPRRGGKRLKLKRRKNSTGYLIQKI
jgi:hypothetical protein